MPSITHQITSAWHLISSALPHRPTITTATSTNADHTPTKTSRAPANAAPTPTTTPETRLKPDDSPGLMNQKRTKPDAIGTKPNETKSLPDARSSVPPETASLPQVICPNSTASWPDPLSQRERDGVREKSRNALAVRTTRECARLHPHPGPLPLGEGERGPPSPIRSPIFVKTRPVRPPLPAGEERGEGEKLEHTQWHPRAAGKIPEDPWPRCRDGRIWPA